MICPSSDYTGESGQMKRKVHRWQPTLETPCGRGVNTVTTNKGRPFDEGVTCLACKKAKSRISLMSDAMRWAVEAEGN